MRVAAVQMTARPARVEHNLERAAELVEEAFRLGCEMVVLPEFFPTAVCFSPAMDAAARPLDGPVTRMMLEAARAHRGYVAGSFIATRYGDNFNTWVLACPDGSSFTHDKDQPTMWENCYYRGGADDGVLETPLGPVGAAMCWELVRCRTARRLRGRVDLLIGGSCWWGLPGPAVPLPLKRSTARRNLEIARETPARMARLLGCPVVHAAHAGEFACRLPWAPLLPYRSGFLGETQIVDAAGEVLARLPREAGEGIAVAEVKPGRLEPSEDIPGGFWIPSLPPLIRLAWLYQNLHGALYYGRRRATLTWPG